jgi:hypothetical protein
MGVEEDLPEYATLKEFLNDLAVNDRFEYFIKQIALEEEQEWLTVERVLGKGTEGYEVLQDFAFRNRDPKIFFSACNLKVHYVFDEDFVNDGSAILIFNLVASRWLHYVWLTDQNKHGRRLPPL